MGNLKVNRGQIDIIDEKIQQLINERAKLALDIGQGKKELDVKSSCYSPERESLVLDAVVKRNQGPLSNEVLKKIYRQIIAGCRNLEQEYTIAFLGPLGTFSHAAAQAVFGDTVTLKPSGTVKGVLLMVQNDEANFCVVPIENSSEGIVKPTLDCLLETDLTICNEVQLPIHHYLLSRCSHLGEINQVYSHPQALMQCQTWLEKNLPHAALFPAKSTSQACMLAANEVNTAAIAGELALLSSGLNVLVRHIEDEKNNTTRFYVFGKQDTLPSGKDKTSLIASVEHTAGALAKLVNIFAKNGINLTLIHSQPAKQKLWQYCFFLEMEGHKQDANIEHSLFELNKEKIAAKLLGSFPRGVI